MTKDNGFSPDQMHYLQGFAMGTDVARKVRGLPVLSRVSHAGETVTLGPSASGAGQPRPAGPESIHWQAQDRQVADGEKLCAEELAKREKNPLDCWEELEGRAARGAFPSGTDVFLTKFHGLFYVAPAQDAYMCRLRLPGGALVSRQLRGLADLADRFAGGFADVTTRANLQLREIGARDGVEVLMGLRDLGIVNLGAGGDNIRNVTASPLSGIDSEELIETLPLARRIHQTILQHREMYGLPRKFNIALDGGGSISALEDTNDIGLHAVRVEAESAENNCPAGIYYRLALGGITGHQDFARDAHVLLTPDEVIPVVRAIVRVFVENGNRTDRKRARLKYVLDAWGFDRFLEATEQKLGFMLRRVPAGCSRAQTRENRWGHVGFHPQKQEGTFYVGVVLPVGRITTEQMRGLATVADRFGSGDIRLTVWQNLLIPNIPEDRIPGVQQALQEMGLDWRATSTRAGLIACTGNAGCKYAAANTKQHAMYLASYIDERIQLDQPLNIHLTGCHHSCAQHYIGDIGLLATSVDLDDDVVEGYHIYVGGGYGQRQAVARQIFESVAFENIPPLLVKMLEHYEQYRKSPSESFIEFIRRHSADELRSMFAGEPRALTA